MGVGEGTIIIHEHTRASTGQVEVRGWGVVTIPAGLPLNLMRDQGLGIRLDFPVLINIISRFLRLLFLLLQRLIHVSQTGEV